MREHFIRLISLAARDQIRADAGKLLDDFDRSVGKVNHTRRIRLSGSRISLRSKSTCSHLAAVISPDRVPVKSVRRRPPAAWGPIFLSCSVLVMASAAFAISISLRNRSCFPSPIQFDLLARIGVGRPQAAVFGVAKHRLQHRECVIRAPRHFRYVSVEFQHFVLGHSRHGELPERGFDLLG